MCWRKVYPSKILVNLVLTWFLEIFIEKFLLQFSLEQFDAFHNFRVAQPQWLCNFFFFLMHVLERSLYLSLSLGREETFERSCKLVLEHHFTIVLLQLQPISRFSTGVISRFEEILVL